eukprot:Anaeramoba_ignava/a482295_7.p2 GENE.a482295_7~~a482295_7.p2  ORF type:complete len:330 (-),score=4.34 a482295_7:666-1655(-)
MFRKYNSIENTYQADFIEKIKTEGYDKLEYVVQEKAHGANMGFLTNDGEKFLPARRTALLEPGEVFYNYQSVLEKNIDKLRSVWADLKLKINNLSELTIYGELIGGDYPHPDIAKDPSATKVQKGIFYSPSNELYVFDILINNSEYLNTFDVEEIFEKHGLLHAKTLFSGSFQGCLAYPNKFESTIYQQLGLPVIKPNVAEGVVIRPVDPCFLNNGSRVLLKNKNEKWEEKAKARKKEIIKKELPEKVKQLQELIMDYVTDNRLNNVLSKTGEISIQDLGKVLGLFAADVIEDFMKDYGQDMAQLEKKEQKLITKSFNKKAVELVKARL